MPRKTSVDSPKRSPPSSPKRSPGRPKKVKSVVISEVEPIISENRPINDVITPLAEAMPLVIAGGIEGQNTALIEAQKIEEAKKLAPGETNWFEILTSMSFILRLMIVVAVMVVCAVIILNVTLDPKSTSWFNNLHKPDWMPDGITIVLIFTFLSFLLAWCWYRLIFILNPIFVNIFFITILALQFCWTLLLYRSQNLVAGRYLSCFFLGLIVLLFLLSIWYIGFCDVSLYLFLYTAWLILVVCFTFGLSDLTKEYKILGIVKNKKSSLYRKKMKMETVEGIKIDEAGNKTVFNAEEQE
jgi:tryptophan-rich sensory protein